MFDPISFKKITSGEERYSTQKCLLGFDFDGEAKTIWLEEDKWAMLLTDYFTWMALGGFLGMGGHPILGI